MRALRKILLYAITLLSLHSFAYKFTCNSIDAYGDVYNDECGICDEQSGPRWLPANVPVHVDLSVLPVGISREDFLQLVQDSFSAWNDVSGSNLRLQYVGDAPTRIFGGHTQHHELFWITNIQEWREKVGGGENGALGVTIAPYFCPHSSNVAREIYDADLVLNGVGGFAWKTHCNSAGNDCLSAASTMTHELGHFVGLGHPCTHCSWSIMSAQSGYNIEKPVFDDQEALRTLYPGASSGAMGSRCSTDADCLSGLLCTMQGEATYCSSPCDTSHPCPSGYACDQTETNSVCKFAIGRLTGAAQKGENCSAKPCADNLLCAGSGGSEFYCFAPCNLTRVCGALETCIQLDNSTETGVCIHIAKVGEKCDTKTPCEDVAHCVATGNGVGTCFKSCSKKLAPNCPQGTVCQMLDMKEAACLPDPSAPQTPPQTEPPAVQDPNSHPGTPVTASPNDTSASKGARCSCLTTELKEDGLSVGAALLLCLVGFGFRRRPK